MCIRQVARENVGKLRSASWVEVIMLLLGLRIMMGVRRLLIGDRGSDGGKVGSATSQCQK
jgi:hypothetical protein